MAGFQLTICQNVCAIVIKHRYSLWSPLVNLYICQCPYMSICSAFIFSDNISEITWQLEFCGSERENLNTKNLEWREYPGENENGTECEMMTHVNFLIDHLENDAACKMLGSIKSNFWSTLNTMQTNCYLYVLLHEEMLEHLVFGKL